MTITRSFICERCGLDLPDSESYRQHKIDHMQNRVIAVGKHPITGEPIENEPETKEVVVEVKENVAENVSNGVAPQEKVVEITQLLELTYLWKGNCTCGQAVETIDIEGITESGKVVSVAWCPVCKKKVKQKVVADLKGGTVPVTIKKKKGGYSVRTPGGIKAKGTTLAKAKKQARLLNAIDHGFKPH